MGPQYNKASFSSGKRGGTIKSKSDIQGEGGGSTTYGKCHKFSAFLGLLRYYLCPYDRYVALVQKVSDLLFCIIPTQCH